ncbi:hypothetical protein VPH35_020909 [Triticum aestivum]
MVRAPAPLFFFFLFPPVGPAYCVLARYVFSCCCDFVYYSRVLQFCRKAPILHAYNNFSPVHRNPINFICKMFRILSSFIICNFHACLKCLKCCLFKFSPITC